MSNTAEKIDTHVQTGVLELKTATINNLWADLWEEELFEGVSVQMAGVKSPSKFLVPFSSREPYQGESLGLIRPGPRRIGTVVISDWRYGAIRSRFSNDVEEVRNYVRTQTTPKYWQDKRHDFSIDLHNLASASVYESQEQLPAVLVNFAMSDKERSDLKNTLSHQSANIKSALAANDPNLGSFDIELYAGQYDKLQTSYIAKALCDRYGIEVPKVPSERQPLLVTPEQLTWQVLPEGTSIVDLAKAELEDDQTTESEDSEVVVDRYDFRRLELLQDIVDLYGNNRVNIYKSRPSTIGTEPYYVAEIVVSSDDESRTIAIAESPVYANATYVVDESDSAGTWEEVLQLTKKEAREVGAHRLIHPARSKDFDIELHKQRILEYVSLTIPQTSR